MRQDALVVPRIDLRSLQDAVSEDFGAWDDVASIVANPVSPVDPNASLVARRARSRIYEKVRAAIPQCELKGPGIYLFCNLAAGDDLGRLVYIGIVKGSRKSQSEAGPAGGHTLAKRMWDHLAKEFSCLQPGLRDIEEEQAALRIGAMLRLLHSPEQARKYVTKHLKGRLMSQADTILLLPFQAPADVLEDAETSLIRAGRPTGDDGHCLVNRQKMRSERRACTEGQTLAERAIDSWMVAGLGEGAGGEWLRRLHGLEARRR